MASWKSYLFVTVQFLCLGLIGLSGPLPTAVGPLALVVCGLLLGLWGLLAMRLSQLSVLPDVRAGARLVVSGPYRLIRHPMYSSLLIACLGLVLAAPLWWRWLLWAALLADLILKLRYEEGMLARAFPDYAAYMRRSWRLLPFVF
ncbi:isoprenylcysteine carboxylmethyltransferase family protein [Chloroflexales bacterium ZM16-3]|nr:isoprenylcysteine carboxylmethyltransferase family protein [Chloroflexales bacterium ZM16-3]